MAQWSALAMGVILPSVGCQVEYAGMTLPSGRYMHDDVQYLPSSPDFHWANTQAATQRARMRAMGIEPPPPPGTVMPAMGSENPAQMGDGRATDVNQNPGRGAGAAGPVIPGPPGAVPPPGGANNVAPPDPQQGGDPPPGP